MLAPKCLTFNGRPTFTNPMCLKKAQSEIPCLYEIPHDHSDPANTLVPDREETLTLERENAHAELQCLYVHKVKECECLAQKLSKQTEFVSKEVYNELLRSFARLEKHSISIELALQQCQEQMKNDTVCKENESNVFQKEREQYFEIQDLKAQLSKTRNCIKYLKKLVENATEKVPKVVPIITRKPKSQANKSVATPHKKTVASESTTQKSKSYYRMLYEKTSKAWKWWIEQQCPLGYKWVPNTKTKWVPKVRNENVQKRVSFAIDNTSRITNIVQPILFIVDSGCTKHMTGNLTLLYTWTLLLRSKDETPEVLKDFLKMIQRNFQAQVITIRTDKGTEFLNKTLHAYFKEEGIEHQTSAPRTPEENGIVERRNRTLVEAARTMLSASKLPLFFWAEAITTACYTQNKSIIILTHEKTAYHIINDRKPSIVHLHIFGCTCYLTRDGENLDKMKEKGDPCILVGYSTQSKGYRASDYDKSGPAPQLQNVSPSADKTAPSQQELDLLFGPLYDEFFTTSTSSVNKSSSPTDNSTQQDTQPTVNIHPSTKPITPTITVHAEENNDNQAADAHFEPYEFVKPFCTL
ncbi:retrovirus-related pol polyprotein from transposon TNT 1-94, partial [Tanacetum coccineum]